MYWLLGLMATSTMVDVCPVLMVRILAPFVGFQRMMVLSSPAVAMNLPSKLQSLVRSELVCPESVRMRVRVFMSQMVAVVPVLLTTAWLARGLNDT